METKGPAALSPTLKVGRSWKLRLASAAPETSAYEWNARQTDDKGETCKSNGSGEFKKELRRSVRHWQNRDLSKGEFKKGKEIGLSGINLHGLDPPEMTIQPHRRLAEQAEQRQHGQPAG